MNSSIKKGLTLTLTGFAITLGAMFYSAEAKAETFVGDSARVIAVESTKTVTASAIVRTAHFASTASVRGIQDRRGILDLEIRNTIAEGPLQHKDVLKLGVVINKDHLINVFSPYTFSMTSSKTILHHSDSGFYSNIPVSVLVSPSKAYVNFTWDYRRYVIEIPGKFIQMY